MLLERNVEEGGKYNQSCASMALTRGEVPLSLESQGGYSVAVPKYLHAVLILMEHMIDPI